MSSIGAGKKSPSGRARIELPLLLHRIAGNLKAPSYHWCNDGFSEFASLDHRSFSKPAPVRIFESKGATPSLVLALSLGFWSEPLYLIVGLGMCLFVIVGVLYAMSKKARLKRAQEQEMREIAEMTSLQKRTFFRMDDLPALEERFSGLQDCSKGLRDLAARWAQEQLQEYLSELNEQRKRYGPIAIVTSPARVGEYLELMRQARRYSPAYGPIFKKHLGDEYPGLLRTAEEYDESLAKAIGEMEQLIKATGNVATAAGEFIARSMPRNQVMTVNDIVVAYEHQYDTIQNLIRGFRRPYLIQDKITEILTANPDADLVPLESSLGIKVISVQRRPKEEKKKSPTVGGIYIGSDE